MLVSSYSFIQSSTNNLFFKLAAETSHITHNVYNSPNDLVNPTLCSVSNIPPTIIGNLRLDPTVRARFLKGVIMERELSDDEETLLFLCHQSASKHGFDKLITYLSGKIFF